MYCKTTLTISQEQAGGNLYSCLPILTNLKETQDKTTGQTYFTGNIKNLRLFISENWVKVTGSLAKFYLGTNLHTLTRSDSKLAFEKMADILHLPVHTAKVTKVEIGHNIITDCKPEMYYPYLGARRYYKRLVLPTSLTYHVEEKRLKLYDKIIESKPYIPDVYKGKNVLRIEFCCLARLNKHLNLAVITPDTLTDEKVYMDLLNRWHEEYKAINKIGIPYMDKSKMKTAGAFLKQAGNCGLQMLGPDFLLNIAREMKANNQFTTSKEYDRAVKMIRGIANSNSEHQSELIQELNEKVDKVKTEHH